MNQTYKGIPLLLDDEISSAQRNLSYRRITGKTSPWIGLYGKNEIFVDIASTLENVFPS